MNFEIKKEKISFILIIFFVISLFFSFNYSIIFFYNVIIFINFYLIFKFRFNPAILLFFIFSLFYTLSLVPYYYFNINVSAWQDFNEEKYYNHVLRIYGCFLVTPLFFNSKNYKNFKDTFKTPSNPNIIAFYFFIIICFVVIIFGQSGNNIFLARGYASDESSKSVIYEYFILFLLIAYYYSNKKKLQIIIILSLFVFYSLKSLLYGGRIEVIQLFILLFYILILDFNLKLNSTKLIFVCLVFYYLNQVFGAIRSNPVPLIEGEYLVYINPFNTFLDSKLNYISSNEGDVFQSSVRLVGIIENGILDFYMRIKAFFYFFLSILLPTSWLPEEASLITYKKDIYNSGGGGLISVYFYAFLGWLGPFFISSYLFLIYKIIKIYKTDYLKLYGLMLFSTFPRWFAYNPIILFKLSLIIIPIVFFINILLRSIKVNKINN